MSIEKYESDNNGDDSDTYKPKKNSFIEDIISPIIGDYSMSIAYIILQYFVFIPLAFYFLMGSNIMSRRITTLLFSFTLIPFIGLPLCICIIMFIFIKNNYL